MKEKEGDLEKCERIKRMTWERKIKIKQNEILEQTTYIGRLIIIAKI
jgi:hypothetical protein